MEGHKQRHQSVLRTAETMAKLEAVSTHLKTALAQIEALLREEQKEWDGIERRAEPR